MSAPFSPGVPLLGVFGGTFDPVHHGHLRSALELVERLHLEQLRMLPSAVPPHREAPECSAAHRAAMLELAVADEPRLACDIRELHRAGKSYSIDTLIDLRGELGARTALCMVVGCDAVLDISTWHRWQELLDWAHIVVIARPGWELPRAGEVSRWLSRHRTDDHAALRQQNAGSIVIEELRPLAISSTEIRELLAAGHSARYLIPESVLDYIQSHQLYQQ